MKIHTMFTYDLYERIGGLSEHLPEFAARLSAIERDVRRLAPENSGTSIPHIFADEPSLQPVLNIFRDFVAEIAGVSIAKVSCVRSWCFVARGLEFVFFDRHQWWSHAQPSKETGLHNHLPYHFTGVYYVAVPSDPPQPIQFLNPIPGGFKQCDWFMWTPSEDRMLVFESHLWHRVPPSANAGADRISLSMDALVIG